MIHVLRLTNLFVKGWNPSIIPDLHRLCSQELPAQQLHSCFRMHRKRKERLLRSSAIKSAMHPYLYATIFLFMMNSLLTELSLGFHLQWNCHAGKYLDFLQTL